jgi:flagellin
MYINTNIVSLNAQANLANSQSTLATDIQRLSSGLRINSAADDAAGMAIATRMGSQIAGQNQAVRNANDGISLSQTAQGAMQSIVANLQTMRDLAVQSANATYSSSDRASMNAEVQQLKAEIDRVAGSTTFNGVNLLDGTFTAQNFQVGANNTSNDSIQVASIANMHTSQLGSAGSSYSATVTGGATTAALNAGDLTLNGYQVGASQLGTSPGQTADSAFSIAQAINGISASSGVTATANASTVTGTAATSYTAVAANTFSINGVSIGAIAAGGNAAGQGANAAAAINLLSAQTGVTAVANATTGALTLTAADGRNISITMNGSGTLGAVGVTGSALNDASVLSTQLGLTTSQIGTQSVAAVAGATAAAGGGTIVSTAPGTAAGTIAAGTLTANGVNVGAVTLTSNTYGAATAAVAAAIGTTLTVSAGMTAGSTYTFTTVGGTAQTFSIVATGVAATDAQAIRTAFNAFAGTTTLTGASNVLTAAGGTFGIAVTSVNGQAITASTAAATANAAQLAVSAGTLGTQAYGGAQYNGQQIAAAINTALASATGGATVNGTAAANAATGIITITSGTSATTIGMGGTAASSAAATTNQTTLASQTGFSAAQLGNQAVTGVAATSHGTVTLTSSSSSGIEVGGAAYASAGLSAGLTAATTTSTVNSISSMDVSTAADASNAIATIDGAINIVNAAAGQMGAVQNRFQSVVSNLQTTVQNLTAAQSRIQDTDFAATTASLTQAQILQQAGTAMLAQANAMPNAVLTLLK